MPLQVIKLQLHMILRGVASCHLAKVAHCDIKPDNVLLGYDLVPRRCDFGFAHIGDAMSSGPNGGTTSYMSPERLVPRHPSAKINMHQADSWSLGVLLYQVIYKRLPFDRSITWTEVKSLPEIDFGLPACYRLSPEGREGH